MPPLAIPDELVKALHDRSDGRPVGLLFDYDGTLVPIRQRPELAVLDPGTRATLLRIPAPPQIRVGVITGRTLNSLTQVAGELPGITTATNGGLRIAEQGRIWVHPEAAALMGDLETVRRQLQPAVDRWPGAWIEDKVLTFTVHFRERPEAGPALREALVSVIAAGPYRLRLVENKQAIEVQPEVAWDKGRAVLELLDRWGVGKACLFVADDAIDEPGFEAIRQRGGVSCCVASAEHHETRAEWLFPDVVAVHELIMRLARDFK